MSMCTDHDAVSVGMYCNEEDWCFVMFSCMNICRAIKKRSRTKSGVAVIASIRNSGIVTQEYE